MEDGKVLGARRVKFLPLGWRRVLIWRDPFLKVEEDPVGKGKGVEIETRIRTRTKINVNKLISSYSTQPTLPYLIHLLQNFHPTSPSSPLSLLLP